MKKFVLFLSCTIGAVLCCISILGCASTQVKQYGLETENTICLNLTDDPNVGRLYVTHMNGVATGAHFDVGFMGLFGGKSVFVKTLYTELNGKPITFTILCPVVTGYDSNSKPIVRYKQTELRLTKLADLKAGDVLTLRWMYQTQTFSFMDATGNIVQQTVPEFY